MRGFAFLVFAMAWFGAGCASQTRPDFRAREIRTGVVAWRNESVGGEARIACERDDAGNLRVRIFDAAPVAIIERIDGHWAMSGPLVRGHWSGGDSAVPGTLEGWLALAEACAGADGVAEGESDVRTGRYSVRYLKRSGRLEKIELVTLATGQRFRASF